ncbi:hypothetical protein RCZ04_11710 [Capnocytophaga sp. HP1101]
MIKKFTKGNKKKLSTAKKDAFLVEEYIWLAYTKLIGSLYESWTIVIQRLCKQLRVRS